MDVIQRIIAENEFLKGWLASAQFMNQQYSNMLCYEKYNSQRKSEENIKLHSSLTEKENQISSLNNESQEKDNYISFLKKELEEMTNKANEEARKNFNLSTLLKENEKKLEFLEKKDNKVDCNTLNNIENILYIQRILNHDDGSGEYERHENCIKYLKSEYEKLMCIIEIENEKKLELLEERVDSVEKSILEFEEFLCKTK